MWNNEYTRWNPSDYGWAYSVSPDPNTVWRPRLTVLNTMKDLKPLGEDYILIITVYDGTTMWFPAERFETFCEVDVTYFPFDIQVSRTGWFLGCLMPQLSLDFFFFSLLLLLCGFLVFWVVFFFGFFFCFVFYFFGCSTSQHHVLS